MLTIPGFYLSIPASRVFAQQAASQLTSEQLNRLARSITVRIHAGNSRGSGTLLYREGQVYTVLTNQHVMESETDCRIQTPDGQIHQAKVISGVDFRGSDLALVQFQSGGDYTVAPLGNLSDLKEGDEVFAAGFPFETDLSEPGGFVFRAGRVSLLLEKALKGGYWIGYTNEIEQGMSGGPLLNGEGKVIGINGIHGQPLSFGDPFVYQDNSKPNDELRERMKRSSWALPIEILAQIAPQFIPANLTQQQSPVTRATTNSSSQLVNKINDIAKETSVLITWPTSNGSGVIIAKDGNTYYVLTAAHVARGNRDLKAVTHDGQQYTLNKIKVWEKVDLALLQFTSNQPYQVATLGNYNLGLEDSLAFVSGWPGSKQATTATVNSARQFNTGFLLGWLRGTDEALNARSFSQGYELVYTNITEGGMSGGPVFDSEGRLIGIHTIIEGVIDDQESPTPQNRKPLLALGYSLGIPIRTFLNKIKQEKISLNFKEETSLPQRLTDTEKDEIVSFSLELKELGSSADEIDWLNYGNKLWRLRRYQQAQIALEKAIEIKPSYEAWFVHGMALKSQKKYQEAKKSFQKALTYKPEYKVDKDLALRQVGDSAWYSGDYEEAVKAFKEAIELKPDDFILYNWLAVPLNELGRYPEALKSGNKAIKIKPDHAESYFRRGQTRRYMGDYRGAIADVNEALRLQPDLAIAYQFRGTLKSEQGDNQGAIADINEALRLQPDNAGAYAARGIVYARMGDQQRLAEDFNKALSLQPDDAWIHQNRGYARFILKDYQKAVEDYTEAIRLAPESAYQFYTERGFVRYQQEDYKKAIEDYTEALRFRPNYVMAYVRRGEAYAKLGNQQGFTEDFKKALSLQPDNAWIYSERGDTYFFLKDKQKGIGDYDEAIRLAPELADFYYNWRGNQFYGQEDYKAAIVDYTKAIGLKPDEAWYYYNRGDAYRLQEDYKEAIADYTEAIRLKPDLADAFNRRAITYARQKNYQGAIKDYTEAIRLAPNNVVYYSNRGNSYSSLKDYQAAIADYTKIIDLQPDNAKSYVQRGNLRYSIKDYQGAIADYTEAIRLKPDFADAYNARGLAYHLQEKYPEAIKDYSEAVRIYPKPFYYGNRGEAHRLQGDYQEAITDYTEAIGLKPDFADAYNARGLAKAEIGDKQGAIEDLQKAAQLFREQGNDDAYQVAQTKIREIQGISTEDEQVSRGNPQNVDAHLGRGIASYKREDYQTAIAEYNEAIRLAPQNAFAYNLRGNAYFAQENYQQAIKDYTQAIRLNPKFAVAYSNRGNIYYELEDYKSAVSDYTEAIRIKPDDADFYFKRGDARDQLEDYSGAIADYTEAIRLKPDYTTAYYYRGISKSKQKDYQAAISDYSQAISQLNYSGIGVRFVDREGMPGMFIGEIFKNSPADRSALKVGDQVVALNGESTLNKTTEELQQLINNQILQQQILQVNLKIKREGQREFDLTLTKAPVINPKSAEIYMSRGTAYRKSNNLQGAREDFQTAADLYRQQNNIEMYQTALEKLKEIQ
ncbi:tetratricopeptide repeat protein [Microcystis aeruginosa]|nr:tetratricopeptide repeat protein [Microcystis aeruginosa]